MTLNIKELATKFVQENKPAGAILSNVENELAFKAYIESSKATIEHLSNGGEFRKWQIYPDCNYKNENDVSQDPLVSECVDVIDHAAILSANAKIAKLEEENSDLKMELEGTKLSEQAAVKMANEHLQTFQELQQRVKELEDFMNLQKTQTHFNLLVKANNRVKDLEALVGTLRGLTGCEDKTVKDVSVEQHSVDIMAKFKELESKLEHAQKIAYDRKNSVRKLEIEIKDAVEVIELIKYGMRGSSVMTRSQIIETASNFLSKRGGG